MQNNPAWYAAEQAHPAQPDPPLIAACSKDAAVCLAQHPIEAGTELTFAYGAPNDGSQPGLQQSQGDCESPAAKQTLTARARVQERERERGGEGQRVIR